MGSAVHLSFPVIAFRHLETPFHKQGYRDHFAVVQTKDLPDLTGWRRINVRDPKMTGAVPNAIRKGFHDCPDMFLFMNRGIVLAVDSVSFDNKTSVVTITLSDPNLHGLLDGGHTYNIVLEETKALSEPQFIKVEILEGFSGENITQVVDARNTSNQVRDESLMNLAGEFEDLKKALEGAHYFQDIAFKEFQTDAEGNQMPIDVREIIAILTAFDRDNFDDKVHPINAYRSKAACLKHFKEHSKSYRKIYPLAQEILVLYDEIQERLPELYNKVRGKTGNVSGGKFGKLTGVTVYEGKRCCELSFTGRKSRYGVPSGFIYPILGAFRALLELKAGRYVWGKSLNPRKLLAGDLGLTLADTIGNFALDAQNPSKTGKSPLVWQACYQAVRVAYLEA
ncbi:MAG TPA: AIPR family protein [Sedimentisphaerales bacterium]|nr:AIPR family protein [Sedimentisphaerales bacterium]